jgi:hypothetical protein
VWVITANETIHRHQLACLNSFVVGRRFEGYLSIKKKTALGQQLTYLISLAMGRSKSVIMEINAGGSNPPLRLAARVAQLVERYHLPICK